jgi:hypothetical protein
MGIKVMVLDAENKEFYSVNGVINDKGFFTTGFLIPKNSQR